MKNKNIHYLSFLVEEELYKTIRAIREGKFPNENKMISNAIDSFVKGLPDYLSELDDSYEFIIKKIEKIDKENARKKR